jgi:hypothetical protein
VRSPSISVTAKTFERLKQYVDGKLEYRTAQHNGKPNYSPSELVDRLINDALDKAGAP